MNKLLIFTLITGISNYIFANTNLNITYKQKENLQVVEALKALHNANMIVFYEDGYFIPVSKISDIRSIVERADHEILDVDSFEKERSAKAIPRTEFC